jgi:hypothetical protein
VSIAESVGLIDEDQLSGGMVPGIQFLPEVEGILNGHHGMAGKGEASAESVHLLWGDKIIGVFYPHNWVVVSKNFDLTAGPFRWIHSVVPTR